MVCTEIVYTDPVFLVKLSASDPLVSIKIFVRLKWNDAMLLAIYWHFADTGSHLTCGPV
jgi:hypothetical protein